MIFVPKKQVKDRPAGFDNFPFPAGEFVAIVHSAHEAANGVLDMAVIGTCKEATEIRHDTTPPYCLPCNDSLQWLSGQRKMRTPVTMKPSKSEGSGDFSEPARSEAHVFKNKAPAGSPEEAVLKPIRDNGMFVPTRVVIKPYAGNWQTDLPRALLVICNPRHPRNKWKYFVEVVDIDGEQYFRLVDTIPLAVKKKWDRARKPPRVTVDWNPFTGVNPRKHSRRRGRVRAKVKERGDAGELDAEEKRRREEEDQIKYLLDASKPKSRSP